jgi:hypothetical protein
MKPRKPLRSKATIVQVFEELGAQLAQQSDVIDSNRRLRCKLQFLIADLVALVSDCRLYAAPYHSPGSSPIIPFRDRSAPSERHLSHARARN